MRTSENITLPRGNEEMTRRAIEQYLQSIRNDIVEIRDTKERGSSLALRRHQFLLMGAQHG